jgi:hypothetical protein
MNSISIVLAVDHTLGDISRSKPQQQQSLVTTYVSDA